MRKIIILSTFLLTASFSFISCRKGAEDPFISLRSRQNRLVGEWKLVNIEGKKITSTNRTSGGSVSVVITTNYADSVKTVLDDITNKDSVYFETLNIKDDGSFSDTIKSRHIKATSLEYSSVRVVSNNWYWLDSKKKKTGIALVGIGEYQIIRLSTKELKLEMYYFNEQFTRSSSKSVEEKIVLEYERVN